MINEAFLDAIHDVGNPGSPLIHVKRVQWAPRLKCWKIQVQDRQYGGNWDGWDIYNDLKRAMAQEKFAELDIKVFGNGVIVQ